MSSKCRRRKIKSASVPSPNPVVVSLFFSEIDLFYWIFVHYIRRILIIRFLPYLHPRGDSPGDFMHAVIYVKASQVKFLYPDDPRCEFMHWSLISLSCVPPSLREDQLSSRSGDQLLAAPQRGRAPHPLPHFCAGLPSGLSFHRSRACCPHSYKLTWGFLMLPCSYLFHENACYDSCP